MIRRICAMVLALLGVVIVRTANAQRSDTAVVNVGAPRNAGVATLVEELTVGNGSAAAEYQFSTAYVYTGPAGGVFVVDLENPLAPGRGAYRTTVRQYDRAGKFVRAFGRSGQGPGEYQSFIADVKHLPDNRVLILDGSARVLVYSATGAPLEDWKLRPKAEGGPLAVGMKASVDPGGFVHVGGTYFVPGERLPGGRRGGPGKQEPFLQRFRLNGTPVDQLTPPEADFPPSQVVGGMLLPFGSRYLASWSPLGYFVTVNTATYEVNLRLPGSRGGAQASGAGWAAGDPVRSIRRAAPPIPISDAERGDWRQSLTMYFRRDRPDWEWSGPDIPRVKPPIRNLQVASDGRIWVQVSQPSTLDRSVSIRSAPVGRTALNDIDAERRWVEPTVYDVFEPAGQYVGQVRFPEYTGAPYLPRMPVAIDGDTVWFVAHDADYVPSVKRYRVNWGRD